MSPGFDLLVRGGTVVTSRATYAADVAIRGETIAAIAAPGTFERAQAANVLEAQDRYVLPGVIDEHVHFREPGLEYKEDFGTGSRAAVMGGVTTVLEMPNTLPPTSTAALVEDKRARAEAKSYCDFGLYGLLVQDSVEQLETMAHAGVVGFKCFLGRSTGDILPPDDGRLLEALGIIARLGLRCGFHAENDQILQHASSKLKSAGRTDPLAHVEARPVVAEVEAIQRAGLFAATSGARIHIFHLSSAAGLATIEEWRRNGVDITCETTPQHCFLSSEQMQQLGSLLRINPPVREAGHGAALLDGLISGRIDALGTDHSPHSPAEKSLERGDIWQAVSGFAGVEISLRLFLTYAVHTGRMSLQQLVRATSEAPARAWGLFPRKGALQVGSDADLTVVDLSVQDMVEEHRLHGKNNLTPFEGHRTVGAAVATVLRGQVVMENGQLRGEPRGRMVRPG
ncbi:MAG: allantoinase AllB [Chloroflexi bacterium]|nr:allantoinase AllB [Chloroflexota bacterium]